MMAVGEFIAWELINISLEFTATAWVGLPRWLVAVVAVNLVTHPALVFIVSAFGRSPLFVLTCEAAVVCVEAFLLMLAYGFVRWRSLMVLSLLMNCASYVIGALLTH